MLSDEEHMQIKVLSKQGKSIREIARIFNISRNTIRRYLKAKSKPQYQRETTSVSNAYRALKGNKKLA